MSELKVNCRVIRKLSEYFTNMAPLKVFFFFFPLLSEAETVREKRGKGEGGKEKDIASKEWELKWALS